MRNGPSRIGDPFAPGARVERGAIAGKLEREQLVGRRDPGPAVGRKRQPIAYTEALESLREHVGVQETAIVIDVL